MPFDEWEKVPGKPGASKDLKEHPAKEAYAEYCWPRSDHGPLRNLRNLLEKRFSLRANFRSIMRTIVFKSAWIEECMDRRVRGYLILTMWK